jgi:hypothetical protein
MIIFPGLTRFLKFSLVACALASIPSLNAQGTGSSPRPAVVTGQAAFADWNQQQPGIRRKITLADLPEPNPAEAVEQHPARDSAPRRRLADRASRIQGHPLRRRRHRAHAAGRQQGIHGTERRHVHQPAPHRDRPQRRSLPG